MSSATPVIVWFRRDLRLADNPAFHAALTEASQSGRPVIPLFIWSPKEDGEWAPGGASKWWLHYSLLELERSLKERGLKLIIQTGEALRCLESIIEKTGAKMITWNRLYEPFSIKRDKSIKSTLRSRELRVESYNSALIIEPLDVKNSSGDPYRIFTPFWNQLVKRCQVGKPFSVPSGSYPVAPFVESVPIADLKLLPEIDWAGGIRANWRPGEEGAEQQLKRFLKNGVAEYLEGRDRPAQIGTSRLSSHLHFGEIGPRQIWRAVERERVRKNSALAGKAADGYLRQLGWRDFGYHLLFHFPNTTTQPLNPKFAKFPWESNENALRAWRRGRTGYPIVDAGMRELWATGWMHNRVRMIVGSFLVKDLRISWLEGAKWFWDTLVDADLANNTLGWQWIAGCGADAAPYFRIFNPVLQGEKFDPKGVYVRRWVKELEQLPDRWIHKPWLAPKEVLQQRKVELGKSYPQPIVDHAEERDRSLELYADL